MDPEYSSGALSCAPKAKDHAPTKPGPREGGNGRAHRNEALELPPAGITRWVIRRKAQVVAAVMSGAITLEEVCQRYSVSKEEFQSWRDLLQRHGMYGLRTTRSQIYRSLDDSDREGEAG
jgi:transposase-like protein